MKISEVLSSKACSIDLRGRNKKEIIEELVEVLIDSGGLEKKSKSKVVEVLMAREALGSTAIGQGIAIPHGKSDATKKLVGCLGIHQNGIPFDALDGEPVYIFFLLVAPIDSAGPHLKALARISRLLKDKFFRDSLRAAKDAKMLMKLIEQEDAQLA